MYADDLTLISTSALDLQKMLNECGTIGTELGIFSNGTKSKCLVIGPHKMMKLV